MSTTGIISPYTTSGFPVWKLASLQRRPQLCPGSHASFCDRIGQVTSIMWKKQCSRGASNIHWGSLKPKICCCLSVSSVCLSVCLIALKYVSWPLCSQSSLLQAWLWKKNVAQRMTGKQINVPPGMTGKTKKRQPDPEQLPSICTAASIDAVIQRQRYLFACCSPVY